MSDPISAEVLNTPVMDLECSMRLYNILTRMGVSTLGELASLRKIELFKQKGCGRTTLNEAQEILEFFGLAFGSNCRHDWRCVHCGKTKNADSY